MEAKEAGASIVGGKDLIAQVTINDIDYKLKIKIDFFRFSLSRLSSLICACLPSQCMTK